MEIEHRRGDDWKVITTDEDDGRRGRADEEDNTEENPVEETDDKDTTKTKSEAEKDYREIEQNVCKGSAELIPDPNRIAKKTAGIYGLGEVLSGRYFTEKIENRFTRAGYKQVATFSKTGFKDNLEGEEQGDDNRPEKEEPKVNNKEHRVSKGDTLWALSKKYYGTGSKWEKIANANGIAKSEVDKLDIGRTLIIPE